MNSQVTVSQPAAFAVYAGKDVSKWEVLIDREIVHRKHGPGHVTRAYLSDFGFRVRVHFDHLERSPERPLVYWEFLDGSIQSISLPVDFCELDTFIAEQGEALLALQIRTQRRMAIRSEFMDERAGRANSISSNGFARLIEAGLAYVAETYGAAEREAAEHFGSLLDKYELTHGDRSPTSPLYAILLKLDATDQIQRKEIEWLKLHRLYGDLVQQLAVHWEHRASLTGSRFNLVSASSHWRAAKKPERALSVTEWSDPANPGLEASRLTTRGGALRDLNRLPEAAALGEQALQHPPETYYHDNLLVAVYFQMGNPEEGDFHFERAKELGAPPRLVESEQRESMQRADPEARDRVARYLLTKNPLLYSWARNYVQQHPSS